MSQLRLSSDQFRRRLFEYNQASELAIRDFQARLGENSTRPAVNEFYRRLLDERCLGRVMDLGCNNGQFAEDVLVPGADRLVLVDFCATALAMAERRVSQEKLAAALNADLTESWTAIDAWGPADTVSLCEVIQHMPRQKDRDRVFRKAADLLAPNGLMLFSNVFFKTGEPREGFYRCDRLGRLLYWHRSDDAENRARFEHANLKVLACFREELSEAFLLQRYG